MISARPHLPGNISSRSCNRRPGRELPVLPAPRHLLLSTSTSDSLSVVVDCVPRVAVPSLSLPPSPHPYFPSAALRSDRAEEVACVMQMRFHEKALSFILFLTLFCVFLRPEYDSFHVKYVSTII